MNRDDILEIAQSLIRGDRAKDYGDAFENHERIAEGWNVIMREALKTHGYLTAEHVALMMDWLKTSRLLHTLDHADSWVDKAAYSALGGEFSQARKDKKNKNPKPYIDEQMLSDFLESVTSGNK